MLLVPAYELVNPGVARNCLPQHGITAKRREFSVLKECKRLFYDLRHLQWLVDIDQRECYQHVSVKSYRRGMKFLRDKVLEATKMQKQMFPEEWQERNWWRWMTDFGEEVGFVKGRLPVGTPELNKETGEPTGRTLAYEFHGNYQGIIRWIRELEKLFPDKEFLPIEDARIVNECGYIFEGSTNQLKYIEEGEV